MSGKRDYYEVLGVAHDAKPDAIKSAFRKLARTYHPDVSTEPDAQARFAEATEAYEILGDAEKRKAYDAYGHAGAAGATPEEGWAGPSGSSVDLNSIFEELFGSRGSPFRSAEGFGGAGGPGYQQTSTRPRPQRGFDASRTIAITFMTAARGGTEPLRLDSEHGGETIDVRIPAGIESGARLRVKGKGRPGQQGGNAGDLLLRVDVGEHPWFSREGLDLTITVPISIAEAVLGTTVTVPLLDGSIDIKVPPGTSSGQRLRVKGKGISNAKGETGNFFAVIRIDAPKELSDQGRAQIESLAAELPDPRESVPWA